MHLEGLARYWLRVGEREAEREAGREAAVLGRKKEKQKGKRGEFGG